MLQTIRDGSKGWMTWFIVGLISLTFIIIGAGNYLSDQSSANELVTKINGIKITKRSVERRAKRILSQTKSKGIDLNLQTAKQQALKEIIQEAHLISAAVKQGFVVSDQQVVALLQALPDFHEKGEFSHEKYKSILAQLEYTEAEFHQEIRQAILIEQLRQALRQTTFTTPEMLSRVLQFENQKRSFDFVLIPNSLFKKEIIVPDSEKMAYYKSHSAQFMTPQKVKIQYLELNRETQSEEIFSKKADELINLSYDHNDSLSFIADKLTLAIKTYPEWIDQNGSYPSFLNHPKIMAALFSEEVLAGMNSEVIQIDENRYIVFRVVDYKKPAQKEFSSVKSEIEARLLTELSAKKAQATSAQWVLAIQKGENWKQVTQQYPLKWESISEVSRSTSNLPLPLIEGVFKLPKAIYPKINVKALTLNEDYQAIVILKKVIDIPAEQTVEQQKQLETQLGYYTAQLEFDLFSGADEKNHSPDR